MASRRGYLTFEPPPQSEPRLVARKPSQESLRTDLCEGPVTDDANPTTPEKDPSPTCTDRVELIERLKRGESPTWIPNRHLESIWGHEPVSPTRTPKRNATGSPNLLPSPTIAAEKNSATSDEDERRREGLKIERPRSALHSGDFTQDRPSQAAQPAEESRYAQGFPGLRAGSHAWLATSPPRGFDPFQFESRDPLAARANEVRSALSSLSSSISTSFAYHPPTSPLVQSESNDDIDLSSPMQGIDIGSGIQQQPRRHTLMARTNSYGFPQSSFPRQTPPLRQERSFPYQAHQPRRSLTSTPTFAAATSSPQTPAVLRSRRPSISSDVSPLQHASMVGSYEESILRGRMSTTPSKPLDFLAQIGVLGLGKCKPSLRCPSHVTLPFPAVFYSYANTSHGRSKEEDGPSPYVGQIDLENGLPNRDDNARAKRKLQSRTVEKKAVEDDVMDIHDGPVDSTERGRQKAQRSKRRSGSPRAPPGGSYRIPEKGQIQIIIKNPNKTAAKLFLVPYDLAGMEPGTKTFVRQRSYSSGPIIENMPNLKDSRAADRPTLRYLVHLHICCPSRGRFYLYKSIRVVFANRVPDGQEKLHNEITLPEPRYTPYKPIRLMHPPSSTGPGASLVADKASRRQSSGFYFGTGATPTSSGAPGDFVSPPPPSLPPPPPPPFNFLFAADDPVPFKLSLDPSRRPASHEARDLGTAMAASSQTQNTRSSGPERATTENRYEKLSKGDVGYGGNAFSGLINGNPAVAESLLSQRLRTLGVRGQALAKAEEPEAEVEARQRPQVMEE
ncbi:hypothetical protein F4780DRAFT_772285 [Xylariomycetidae sp. FL0641]|nr:hypothetical protein F4780DRAFT_772285 [Xylariomycetidae sp. FL0641]